MQGKTGWWMDVAIDPERVIEQLAEQPAMYAFFGAVAVEAKFQYEESKDELKVLEAQLDGEFREEKKHSKKTESEIKAEVLMDSRYKAKKREVGEKKRRSEMCQVAVEAAKQRLESLRSIGARFRVELENSLGIPGGPSPEYPLESQAFPHRPKKGIS